MASSLTVFDVTASQARKRCPELLLVSGEDLTPYRRASKAIMAVLSRFGPAERLGLDEVPAIMGSSVGLMGTSPHDITGPGQAFHSLQHHPRHSCRSCPPVQLATKLFACRRRRALPGALHLPTPRSPPPRRRCSWT